MKKTIVSCLVLVTALYSSFAQGTVNFANAGAGLNAPVFLSDGVTKVSGAQFQAQLLAGPSAGSLSVVGSPASFLTGAGAGYFNGGAITVNSLSAGGPGFFQVQVWNSSFGATFASVHYNQLLFGDAGESSIFNLAATGNPTTTPAGTPATLIGLTSFSLNLEPGPEPATVALLGVGAACMFAFRRRK